MEVGLNEGPMREVGTIGDILARESNEGKVLMCHLDGQLFP